MQVLFEPQSVALVHCTHVFETGSQIAVEGSFAQSRLDEQVVIATHTFLEHVWASGH
jgi:hypothetical protein